MIIDSAELPIGRLVDGVEMISCAEARALIAAERERCARLVPTNWCDSLLTGKDASPMPLNERGVEALLRGIQDRIRKQER